MNIIRNTLLTAMLSVMAGQAMAANDKVDIKVTGQIVLAACTVGVDGGGTIDYGTIPVSSLDPSDYSMQEVKEVGFNVNCGAPMKIALQTTDLRPDSVEKLTDKKWRSLTSWSAAEFGFGLGKSGDKNIGAWAMWMDIDTVLVDSKKVITIWTFSITPEDTEWINSGHVEVPLLYTTSYHTFAAPGTLMPMAFKNLTGKLSVQAGINKSSELDLSKPVNLDGLASIQVYYL